MAAETPQPAGGPGKLVIRNIGLMLSGDLNRPILEADALVAENGRIAAIGRASELDLEGAVDGGARLSRLVDAARADGGEPPVP